MLSCGGGGGFLPLGPPPALWSRGGGVAGWVSGRCSSPEYLQRALLPTRAKAMGAGGSRVPPTQGDRRVTGEATRRPTREEELKTRGSLSAGVQPSRVGSSPPVLRLWGSCSRRCFEVGLVSSWPVTRFPSDRRVSPSR